MSSSAKADDPVHTERDVRTAAADSGPCDYWMADDGGWERVNAVREGIHALSELRQPRYAGQGFTAD
jgi:hypothetical protein